MLRLLVALLLHAVACAGQSSRLTTNSSISGNQTLVSEGGGDFALGFFTPSNSSSGNWYLGIWDNKIPGKSVVWTANRESPVKDAAAKGAGPAAALTITRDGNLAVSDANGTIVWTSGLASSNTTTYAVLLDTSNLELRRAAAASGGGADTPVWQSFDEPADTWLPNMKLWLDIKTGASGQLVSWKEEALEPSPGYFSLGIDPVSPLQYKIWRRGGLEVWGRSDVWGGLSLSAGRQNLTHSVIVLQMDFDEGRRLSYSFSITKDSPPARVVLPPSGLPTMYFWQPSVGNWYQVRGFTDGCSLYNRCGHDAICLDNVTATAASTTRHYCRCLTGFVPAAEEEWGRGNHSRGCTRRVPLPCNGSKEEEGFLVIHSVKLPDGFRLVVDANEEKCVQQCLRNCSCTAYSFSNSSVMLSSTRCLVWYGDLYDLANYKNDPSGLGFGTSSSSTLYIRLVASELAIQPTNGSSSKRTTVIAVVVPVVVIGILLSVALAFILIRRFRAKRGTVLLDDLKKPYIMSNEENPTMLPVLNFSILQSATNNFSMENRLGEGGFGPVYKGKFHGGQEVAIKRLSKSSRQGFQEFRNEVDVIARLQHTNLVRLLGLCVHDNEKILIYEYMPNKSLDKFLFYPGSKEELTWSRRFNIIQGIAQGLLYLHRYSRLRIIHRDLKASNILLDGDMNAKISDFGLARIFGKDQTQENTNKVVGTIGYMSPEYAFDGLFSEKSDVYAFGVIMLEIVTGKRSTGFSSHNESVNLLGYVWEHWEEGKSLDLVDSSLASHFSVNDVMKCIQIGLLCAQDKAFDRPTMTSVVSMLDTENANLPSPNPPPFSKERGSDAEDSQCHVYTLSSSYASTT